MINLTQAFKLCDVDKEMISLVDAYNPKTTVYGWSEDFKKKFDFSKITVTKIKPKWSFEGEWIGLEFVVKVDTDYKHKVFRHENFNNSLSIY